MVNQIKPILNPTTFEILSIMHLTPTYGAKLYKEIGGTYGSILQGIEELKSKGLIEKVKGGHKRQNLIKLTQRGLIAKDTYLSFKRLVS